MTHTRTTGARPAITLALAATAMLAITTIPETARAMAAAVDDTFAVPALASVRVPFDEPDCRNFPPQDCWGPVRGAETGRCFIPGDMVNIECRVRCNEGGTIGPITLICDCNDRHPGGFEQPHWICVPYDEDWPGGSDFPDFADDEFIGDAEEQPPEPEVLY